MACTFTFALCFSFLLFLFIAPDQIFGEKEKKAADEPKWKKKNIQDYSDADVERLYEQWEDGDEDELEEDELPEWKREPPKVDMSKIDPQDPEGMLQMTKKGRTLMMFASVSGNPTQAETETVTQIWQGSLFNANLETQRYVVSDDRVIFMLKDGGTAWQVKDFLVKQDRCSEVTIEGKSYPGKGAEPGSDDKDDEKKSDKAKKDKKKLDKIQQKLDKDGKKLGKDKLKLRDDKMKLKHEELKGLKDQKKDGNKDTKKDEKKDQKKDGKKDQKKDKTTKEKKEEL